MGDEGDDEDDEADEADVEVPSPFAGDEVLPIGEDDGRELKVLEYVPREEELESPNIPARSKLQIEDPATAVSVSVLLLWHDFELSPYVAPMQSTVSSQNLTHDSKVGYIPLKLPPMALPK